MTYADTVIAALNHFPGPDGHVLESCVGCQAIAAFWEHDKMLREAWRKNVADLADQYGEVARRADELEVAGTALYHDLRVYLRLESGADWPVENLSEHMRKWEELAARVS